MVKQLRSLTWNLTISYSLAIARAAQLQGKHLYRARREAGKQLLRSRGHARALGKQRLEVEQARRRRFQTCVPNGRVGITEGGSKHPVVLTLLPAKSSRSKGLKWRCTCQRYLPGRTTHAYIHL